MLVDDGIKICKKCKSSVKEKKNLFCVACRTWFHPECVFVDDGSYKKICELGDKVTWMCETCIGKLKNNKSWMYDGNEISNLHKPINNLLKIVDGLSEDNSKINKKLDTVIEANERLANIVLSLESKIFHQAPSATDQRDKKYKAKAKNNANRSELVRNRNKFVEDESNTYNKSHKNKEVDSSMVEHTDNDMVPITKHKLTYEYTPAELNFRNREADLSSQSYPNAINKPSFRTTTHSLRESKKSSKSLSGLRSINSIWKFLSHSKQSNTDYDNVFFRNNYYDSVPSRQPSNVTGRTTPRPTQKINRDTFAKQCLERHNKYRDKHQLEPLKLSSELSAFAQDWADHLASVQTMTHRTKNRYGENLWAFMTTDPNHKVLGSDAVDSWYKDELNKYTFGTEPKDLKAGHLTQVLWAGSERLGVGVAKSGNYTFVVCNYDPPGNYKGEYADNVPPIGGWKDKEKIKKTAGSSDSLEVFTNDSLRIHNEFRAKHGVPPMALDANISKYAQEWADYLAQKDLFKHRPNNNYGENLFWSSGKASAKIMCDGWYNEEAGYDYTVDPIKSGAGLKSGHFTQLVWKESKYLGIGRAFTKNGAMIGVANYSPRGNIVGQFTSSVLPPIKRR